MARPTAAAGGLAACAVSLLFAGQSVAISFPFADSFPSGYVPPTVRIFISGKQFSLNVAIRNGEVVLVTATYDYGDNTQIWWKIPPVTSLIDGEGDKYWLVNVATGQAITSPTQSGQVHLAQFTPLSSTGDQLWVPSPPRPQDDGFYQIKPYIDDSMALTALDGALDIHDGTKIGINSSTPITSRPNFPQPWKDSLNVKGCRTRAVCFVAA